MLGISAQTCVVPSCAPLADGDPFLRALAELREALVLHEEGMTIDRIAEKFGVTRQRVSGLLREARANPD